VTANEWPVEAPPGGPNLRPAAWKAALRVGLQARRVEESEMTHPIVGLWKVATFYGGHPVNWVVHRFHRDGFFVVDGGMYTASGIWEATGDRTLRGSAVRPAYQPPGTDPGERPAFLGWHTLEDFTAMVSEDGYTYTGVGVTARPMPDGTIGGGEGEVRGERVTLG